MRRWKLLLSPQPMSRFDIGFWVVVTVVGSSLAAVGVWSGKLWLMGLGGMLIPLAYMFRGQFSLRRLFAVVTLFAVLMAVLAASERWRVSANREARLDAIRKNRALLESNRNKVSPEFYEQRRKELDDEAAKLDSP